MKIAICFFCYVHWSGIEQHGSSISWQSSYLSFPTTTTKTHINLLLVKNKISDNVIFLKKKKDRLRKYNIPENNNEKITQDSDE